MDGITFGDANDFLSKYIKLLTFRTIFIEVSIKLCFFKKFLEEMFCIAAACGCSAAVACVCIPGKGERKRRIRKTFFIQCKGLISHHFFCKLYVKVQSVQCCIALLVFSGGRNK